MPTRVRSRWSVPPRSTSKPIAPFSLQIQVTDSGSPAQSGTGTVTINLTDVNEAPDIADATFTIHENEPDGTLVGTLPVSDPDGGQTHTFTITNRQHRRRVRHCPRRQNYSCQYRSAQF